MTHQALVTLDMYRHAVSERMIRVSPDGEDANAATLCLALLDVEPGESGHVRVTMPRWLAKKRGWA